MDIEIDYVDQIEESDMFFFMCMVEMLGVIIMVKSGNLLFIMFGGGVNVQGQLLLLFVIICSSGDCYQFCIVDCEVYMGVCVYWFDFNYGKKKKVSVKCCKLLKFKKEKSSSCEGDYMEGVEGNVFVLCKIYQNEQVVRCVVVVKWQ